ncbi:unnamed protein product [Acanthoscelides obtectus]|uniref:Uncharacterized protein n=1 Tax=Acanthoscelides obtectus TaxID=200917 RepID=A0A9P0KDQ9_ACAOB|nr:unnamed protein product [Acanthoscelides obtectus]CAK1646830.1 hypothetical protein AOBTE_LOCUS14881 [Acanthoscelides obtectus]
MYSCEDDLSAEVIPIKCKLQRHKKTKNEQNAYMQALIECSEISRKRPRVDQNNAKPKSKSYKYYVSSSSGKHRERFSLSFGRPQVDTCCTCEELSNKIKPKALNDVAKRVAVAEKIVHQRRAKQFYSKMKSIEELCQTDPSVGAICVDFMQNLTLPVIPVQDTFYLHQLTVNVFNIHDLKSGRTMFYVYHEDLGRFKTVNQYFPVRGHSYMPCDRDFAMAKRKIKNNDRMYLLKDYVSLILNSSTKNKFSVYVMDGENTLIKDYKKWWPLYYKKKSLSTESYIRVGIQRVTRKLKEDCEKPRRSNVLQGIQGNQRGEDPLDNDSDTNGVLSTDASLDVDFGVGVIEEKEKYMQPFACSIYHYNERGYRKEIDKRALC